LPGGVGFCNAVRRSLVSDVKSWAPRHVTIRENTSSYADEYIAHRIGLVPFRCVGNGKTMTLKAQGPKVVYASDVIGPAFESIFNPIEIVHLKHTQAIDLTIHFDRQCGSKHARYASCAAVGLSPAADGHTLRFDCWGDPKEQLERALDALDAKIDRALQSLAHQPAEPPRSMC
jgi:hypothetical protein